MYKGAITQHGYGTGVLFDLGNAPAFSGRSDQVGDQILRWSYYKGPSAVTILEKRGLIN
jgi:hypothetical protein